MSDLETFEVSPPKPAENGPDVKAGAPIFSAVIEIRRAATGAIERYTLTGTPVAPHQEQ